MAVVAVAASAETIAAGADDDADAGAGVRMGLVPQRADNPLVRGLRRGLRRGRTRVVAVLAAAVMEATPAVRIDKWLWAVRLFSTRSAAADACNGGKVTVNGVNAKPSRSIRAGDVITAHTGILTRTVKVTSAIERRIGAPLVASHLEDLTPAAEYESARQRASSNVGYRPPGAGRPTKRDRRILQSFFGENSTGESGDES